ncbi:MAG: prephenate dehydratase [Methanobacteriota archaeon]|nr:MAG: prephenate dehydratase [Euryarchaeota archaeon]
MAGVQRAITLSDERLVAFQGERGAYSEDACFSYFGNGSKTKPFSDFKSVFEAVERDNVTHAVVPVENSIEGSVTQVNDLLLDHDLTITGEVIVPVKHCLMAHPDADMSSIVEVSSHPQALGQCRKFLQSYPDWRQIPAYDTAGSARMVAESGRTDIAAIASRRAASVYKLKILKEDIQSEMVNYTRFFVLEKNPLPVKDANKTSIVFATKNVPGALYNAMGELASRGINLSKLESRPRRNKPWVYVFYADFDGSMDDPNCHAAVGGLLRTGAFVKVLGSYRRAEGWVNSG